MTWMMASRILRIGLDCDGDGDDGDVALDAVLSGDNDEPFGPCKN